MTKRKVNPGAGPLDGAAGTVTAFKGFLISRGGLPFSGHIQQVHEEVVGQQTRTISEHAVTRTVIVGAEGSHTTHEHCHLGRGQLQEAGPLHQQMLRLDRVARAQVVAETVKDRLEHIEGLSVGHVLSGIGTARGERHSDIHAGVLGGLLHCGATTEHDQVSERHFLATRGRTVELCLHTLEYREHLVQHLRVIGFPETLRSEAQTSAIGTATLIGPTEGSCSAPRGEHQFLHAETGGEHLGLERCNVRSVHECVIHCRYRVLPDLSGRYFGSDQTGDRAHVTMGQLVPGLAVGISKLFRVLIEVAGDLFVDRIHPQRHVGGGHHRRMALG